MIRFRIEDRQYIKEGTDKLIRNENITPNLNCLLFVLKAYLVFICHTRFSFNKNNKKILDQNFLIVKSIPKQSSWAATAPTPNSSR